MKTNNTFLHKYISGFGKQKNGFQKDGQLFQEEFKRLVGVPAVRLFCLQQRKNP